jgi:hypothetical protein
MTFFARSEGATAVRRRAAARTYINSGRRTDVQARVDPRPPTRAAAARATLVSIWRVGAHGLECRWERDEPARPASGASDDDPGPGGAPGSSYSMLWVL